MTATRLIPATRTPSRLGCWSRHWWQTLGRYASGKGVQVSDDQIEQLRSVLAPTKSVSRSPFRLVQAVQDYIGQGRDFAIQSAEVGQFDFHSLQQTVIR
jgi:hypothetical protein